MKKYDALSSHNIVMIDDSVDMLNLMEKFIERDQLGRPVSFENEFQALSFLSEEKVDLIVIDVALDYSNGFKIGKMLRNVLVESVPIIYISSNEDNLENFYHEDQRNTYFMKKPFDHKTFSNVVKTMIASAA